jgi:DNA-binding NarL/FixJ family response regulator
MPIELIVADPRAGARETLRSIVSSWGWKVIAEANDGLEAIRLSRELDPDVVLIDSIAGGAETADIYTRAQSSKAPLVVRLIDSPQEHAGAGGLTVMKGVPGDKLRKMILAALEDREAARQPIVAGHEMR